MLTTPRWEAECRLMHNNFPQFEPFAVPGREAGFRGHLIGPRTGIPYEVTIMVPVRDYPAKEPGVYMTPHPESHHWIIDNRLATSDRGMFGTRLKIPSRKRSP